MTVFNILLVALALCLVGGLASMIAMVLLLVLPHFKHKHDWDTKEAKRYCKTCGEEQWLMSRPYSAVGEPAMFWRTMTFTPPGEKS